MPRLLRALIMCFKDASWPVRRAARATAGLQDRAPPARPPNRLIPTACAQPRQRVAPLRMHCSSPANTQQWFLCVCSRPRAGSGRCLPGMRALRDGVPRGVARGPQGLWALPGWPALAPCLRHLPRPLSVPALIVCARLPGHTAGWSSALPGLPITLTRPTPPLPGLPQELYSLWFAHLSDNIFSVREDTAVALGNAGAPLLPWWPPSPLAQPVLAPGDEGRPLLRALYCLV